MVNGQSWGLIFCVFLNDPLHKLGCLENCDLYNYADDNAAGASGKTHEEAYSHWLNFMQANTSKFQFTMFDKKT